MRISFSPQRSDEKLTIVRSGDTLKINRKMFNFTQMPPGATLPADAVDCPFFAGPVERDLSGGLHIRLRLPHGANPSLEQLFPVDVIDPPDGPVLLPQPLEGGDA